MRSLFCNPVLTDDQGRDHGDPFVLQYLDTYYLYHTGPDSVRLYTSHDLVNWSPKESPWNEGPFVLKRRGVYYQMYSGGCYRDGTYGVGFATAPSPRGPWTKYERNPILGTTEGISGPGHHCVVRAPNGVTNYAVYHGYVDGAKGRKVHIDRLFWVGDRIAIAGPTKASQPIPPRPVYDAEVPHWHLEAWVRGPEFRLGEHTFGLAGSAVHRVQVVRSDSRLRVYVDGLLQHDTSDQGVLPRPQAEHGTVKATRLTSWLDDAEWHELPIETRMTWRWGGRTDLEVSMAVKGAVTILVKGPTQQRIQLEDTTSFEHVLFNVASGADTVEAIAGDEGAIVTEVTLTAR